MAEALGAKRVITITREVYAPVRQAGAFDLDKIGKAVSKAREAAKFSQDAVGQAAGTSGQVVAGLESGKHDIRMTSFAGICYVLNLDPGKLLADSMAPAKPDKGASKQ